MRTLRISVGCAMRTFYQFRLRRNDKRSEDTQDAVSLPELIVGTRHCRVLISGNINSDATVINRRDTSVLSLISGINSDATGIDKRGHGSAVSYFRLFNV